MEHLAKYLSPKTLKLTELLLDPNNPRFSELREDYATVAESRYADEKVQQIANTKMRNALFNVAELRDTIKTIGFLPMDRIVVREWDNPNGDSRYVVIEGNRRVTALKWLLQLHEEGKENLDDEFLKSLEQIESLILDRAAAPDSAQLILPGLRHVSGVKEWGPYQKAKAVYHLRQTGLSPQDSAQSLGLSTRAANQSYRCFLALENMASDEEYEERVTPDMYSYFEELFKRPVVRDWLEWDDAAEKFKNTTNLSDFYSWIVKPEDGEDSQKLPEAKSVRELALFINDDAAMSVFRSDSGNLTRALAKFEVDHPEDWFPRITEARAALRALTPDILRSLDNESIKAINELQSQITATLTDREKLMD